MSKEKNRGKKVRVTILIEYLKILEGLGKNDVAIAQRLKKVLDRIEKELEL